MQLTKEQRKKKAAEESVKYIKSGMTLGLGTGSTVYYMINKLAAAFASGELINIKCIPSSTATENIAKKLKIPLTTLDENPVVDLTIDGADEVDKDLNLIKGGGGALLREKILAQASRQYIIIADDSKMSKQLGEKFFVPVEVVPFALMSEKKYLESLGAECNVRINQQKKFFITDEGNYILDADFNKIENAFDLEAKLNARAGIVEHGLFLNMTDLLLLCDNVGNLTLKSRLLPASQITV